VRPYLKKAKDRKKKEKQSTPVQKEHLPNDTEHLSRWAGSTALTLRASWAPGATAHNWCYRPAEPSSDSYTLEDVVASPGSYYHTAGPQGSSWPKPQRTTWFAIRKNQSGSWASLGLAGSLSGFMLAPSVGAAPLMPATRRNARNDTWHKGKCKLWDRELTV
jgi:hypothetical protein